MSQCCSCSPKADWRQNSLSLSVFLLRPSADWMRPTHVIDGDLLYSKSIDFNVACMLSHFCHVQLFVTVWTVASQAPLSMGFSKQEYWGGLLCPPPGDLPNPAIKPASLMAPALAVGFFTICATWLIPSQNIITAIPRLVFDQISRCHDLAKLCIKLTITLPPYHLMELGP